MLTLNIPNLFDLTKEQALVIIKFLKENCLNEVEPVKTLPPNIQDLDIQPLETSAFVPPRPVEKKIFIPPAPVDTITKNKDIDSAGVEYNSEIHSRTAKKNADGTWRAKRKSGEKEEAKPVSALYQPLLVKLSKVGQNEKYIPGEFINYVRSLGYKDLTEASHDDDALKDISTYLDKFA